MVDKKNLYEAMFLVDSSLGGSEFPGVVREIADIIKRHGAEVRQIQKWSDRKLCYDISGIKRGLYVLVHFEAPTGAITGIRRDVYLTERLVRVLVLRVAAVPAPTADTYDESGELVAKYVPPEPAVAPAPAAATEAPTKTQEVTEGGQSK